MNLVEAIGQAPIASARSQPSFLLAHDLIERPPYTFSDQASDFGATIDLKFGHIFRR
jgi:hypothetical protein